MRAITLYALGAILLAIAADALAHHSYAMFDTSRKQTIAGTVRTLEWVSPHVWLWIEVPDGKGGSDVYGFETVSPGQIRRDYGWDRNVLHVGDKVTVEYAPLRSGKNGGELEKVTLEDGRVLATRFAQGSAPAPADPSAAKPGK
jgi:Family of unknown function (DUF6152)